MGIGEGLKKLRKNKNMTMEQLATDLNNKYPDLMKLTKGKISKWENEKEEPRLSTAKILAEYFNVKINDLYSESNTTYKDDNDITSIYNKLTPPRQENVLNYANEQLEEQNKVTSIDGYKESKLVSYIACGATGAGIGEELYDDILHEEAFFKEDETPSNADFCILVNGDSMEPMLKQGTYAFIKKEDSIKDGTIALVVLDGVSLIKRVDICEDYINLVSLNPKYDDIKVASFSNIKVMGKVVL
ncbi:TPA: LexA family transcriptional regulator [Staphylococcus aureus]|nr:LexA family transcriptional regulator [Staphylococcus aureus]HDB6640414.1 LexA family transcriptional regulator [Staphylococcus aureus]